MVEAGASVTLSAYNSGGCNSVIAVLTNQSTVTVGTDRSYKLSLTVPPAVTLVSPVGLIDTYSPSYSWNNEPSSTWYYLWVDGPNGNVIQQWYTSTQANCDGTTCSVTPATALGGGTYTWWVQTWNPAGYGPWSAGMSFSITCPDKPILISPSGKLVTFPSFIWHSVAGASWYRLWLDGPSGNVNHTVVWGLGCLQRLDLFNDDVQPIGCWRVHLAGGDLEPVWIWSERWHELLDSRTLTNHVKDYRLAPSGRSLPLTLGTKSLMQLIITCG